MKNLYKFNSFTAIWVLILFSFSPRLQAQDYRLDTTFAPDYSFRAPNSYHWENVTGGIFKVIPDSFDRLYLIGGFRDPYNSANNYYNGVRLTLDGMVDHTMPSELGGCNGVLARQNGNSIFVYHNSHIGKMDMQSGALDSDFDQNMVSPYNVSALVAIGSEGLLHSGNTLTDWNLGVTKFTLRKISNEGIMDTTFSHSANSYILDAFNYDSERILLSGKFTMYDSVPVNKLIRIYNDGTLDTTFNSIIISHCRPAYVDSDGKIIVGGTFQIEDCPYWLGMVRLNADGSLDSTFNNFNNMRSNEGLWTSLEAPPYSRYQEYFLITVCPTPNNKYLIGGSFINYQGYPAKRLALTDMNGFLDTISPFINIDTCYNCNNYTYVRDIKPAGYDSYYVAGLFAGYRGHEVEPIIRIYNASNSVSEEANQHIQIFPNPVNDIIQVKVSSHNKGADWSLQNLDGKCLLSGNITQEAFSVNVQDLPPGVYIFSIRNKEESFSSKLIIQ